MFGDRLQDLVSSSDFSIPHTSTFQRHLFPFLILYHAPTFVVVVVTSKLCAGGAGAGAVAPSLPSLWLWLWLWLWLMSRLSDKLMFARLSTKSRDLKNNILL